MIALAAAAWLLLACLAAKGISRAIRIADDNLADVPNAPAGRWTE